MPEGAERFPHMSCVTMVNDLFTGVVPRVAPGRGTVLINTGKGTLMANDAGAFVEKAGHGRGRGAITTVSA
jgi:hypothetical protein